ncbi:hypothetical protein V2S66_34045 [Streptomyces sp. V4-01]|uniref:Uncharacterized protein n=1 Tax=Actinacidiphila polyblastidii TaxID=3110430 RepID=A0ABU7PMB3_9ACTN|nr:hypothetical protein [Streptomyces sp. V4-01]
MVSPSTKFRTAPAAATTAAVALIGLGAGTASELHSGAGCAGDVPWRTGSLAQNDLPWHMLSHRVVGA